jgi:uncharacterized protein (DUF58 family)
MFAATAIKHHIDAWMRRREGGARQSVTLRHRRIYIVPSGYGAVFAVVLFALLTASINYNLSLGYVLTFLLASMALVSMLHTFRNLSRLTLRGARAEPVFAGETARYDIAIENDTDLPRLAIGLKLAKSEAHFGDVSARRSALIPVYRYAERRGWQALGRFRAFTRYPLGLFHAWSNVELDARCLVYPKPETGVVPPPSGYSASERGVVETAGDDEFVGSRHYRPGDSPRHIAWKAYARERGLLTKQYASYAKAELWLEWEQLTGMDVEARLARLTRWAIDAHAVSASFGLRLPSENIAPDQGEEHLRRVLRALALFEPSGPLR